MDNKVPFNQLRYGTRFKYREDDKQVFVRLGHDLVADWDGTLHAVACNRQGLYCFKDDTTPLDTPVCVVENAASTSLNLVECDACPTSGGCVDKCMKAPAVVPPINMILMCPSCGLQHIDEPHGDWLNPPHRSHECQGCGYIWRVADVPTNGVRSLLSSGKSDSEPVDCAHVTRLQAEVKRLGSIGRGQRKTIDNVQLQVERLQSELTKLGDDYCKRVDELIKVRELLEEPFQLVFEGYNRPGTDFATDAAWATWQHAQLTKAFALLRKVCRPANQSAPAYDTQTHPIQADHASINDKGELSVGVRVEKPLIQQFEDAFRATGYVTNGQACELAEVAVEVWGGVQIESATEAKAIELLKRAKTYIPWSRFGTIQYQWNDEVLALLKKVKK